MIQSYANKLTLFLMKSETIDKEEEEIYQYGFEVLIAFLVNIIAILGVASIFGKFTQTIAFLICYCCLRQYAGGFHASNYKKCLLLFICLYTSNIVILETLMSYGLRNLIFIISVISICLIGPMESENNELDEDQLIKYKKITRCIASIILLVSILIYGSIYSIYIGSALILTSIMLVLELKRKKG